MLKKLLLIFKTIITNPKTLLRVLNPNENEAKTIISQKYKLPEGLPIVSLLNVTEKSQGTISPYLYLEGGSLPTDHYLLTQLAQQLKTPAYFEIGTWRGESIMNVVPYTEEAYTLNLSDTELLRRGANPEYIQQSGMLIPKDNPKIKQLYGDSLLFDFSPWFGKCDLVFIDGDHHYSAIVSDTRNALKMLKNDNSTLVWHDYGFSPEEIRWEVLLAILDAVPAAEHKYLYHVANTKSAIYTKRALSATYKKRPLAPEVLFNVTLQMKKL